MPNGPVTVRAPIGTELQVAARHQRAGHRITSVPLP